MFKQLKHIKERLSGGILKDAWVETKWLYLYSRKYWGFIILYTVVGLLGTAVSLGSSLISRNLVDIITGHQTGRLIQTFCLFIGFSIGSICISQASSYFSNLISLRVNNDMEADIFEKILMTDWESLTAYHTGDLLTRWGSDTSNVSNGILSWLPNLVINIAQFVSSFAVILYYDPTFALISMMSIPVSIVMSHTLLNRMQDNNKRSAAMGAKMSGFNQECFSNIQTLKAFDLIRFFTEKLRTLQKEYLGMRLSFQKLSIHTSVIMSIVGLAVSCCGYGWGIYRVWSGAISFGTMTLFLSLSGTLTGNVNSLISMVPTAFSITTSAGRLMDILEMPREDFSKRDETARFCERHRAAGIGFHISGLDYAYHNGTQVFQDAELEAHPHEIVALVGASGQGKTTMLRILLSLLRPQHGSLCFYAGDDISQQISFSPSTRQLFSYVPQGNTMFSGTVAENLRSVKPDADDSELESALKAACAWDFISALPDGINSKVGERGGGFSEGQAQRLAIARALLRRSPLLLLDEATSALDVAVERQILRNIMQDDTPRTCVITTHRPTALTICHRVYAIQDKKCRILSPSEIDSLIQNF